MQDDSERRSNAVRSNEMRERLIKAARELFATRGYAETGTPEIVASAGVTRGALYHHFADKRVLFQAVAEREAAAVSDEIAQAEGADQLAAGSTAYFAAMAYPGRARLLLIDGPAVLGASAMADLDRHQGLQRLQEGLAEVVPDTARGYLAELAEVLSAGFDRAALAIADGADPEPYQNAIGYLLKALSEAR